ncbi:hypothetical protein VTJ04DRAFT_6778 [Mycothermus thermophilus]|uniref:uncharacterized protein n=1 Tax=Humicola insolens TaxID=85995 RepID=UPI003742B1B8
MACRLVAVSDHHRPVVVCVWRPSTYLNGCTSVTPSIKPSRPSTHGTYMQHHHRHKCPESVGEARTLTGSMNQGPRRHVPARTRYVHPTGRAKSRTALR